MHRHADFAPLVLQRSSCAIGLPVVTTAQRITARLGMFEFDNPSNFTQLQTTLATTHITRQHRSVFARFVVLVNDFKNKIMSTMSEAD